MEPQTLQPTVKMSKIELCDTFPASSLKNQKWMSPNKIVYKQGFPQVLRIWEGCTPQLGGALQNLIGGACINT